MTQVWPLRNPEAHRMPGHMPVMADGLARLRAVVTGLLPDRVWQLTA